MNISEWFHRWAPTMPTTAREEFIQILFPHSFVEREANGPSESAVQADARLIASAEFGTPLWRNNSGAAAMINPKRPDDPPRHVRFGLGNDSAKLNEKWKSSDLIGVKPLMIERHHVGRKLGVFTAIEVKETGWTFKPSDKRAKGQATFMNAVAMLGGLSGFAQSKDDVRRILSQHNK